VKIGIFGGTFNPPHVGHLIVIESVQDQERFDTVLFVPSASPPNKQAGVQDGTLAPAADRLKMVQLATHGNPKFEVSDLEVRRAGPSFTIDTVDALAALYPDASLSLIIGSDNLLEFHTWKSPKEITAKAGLVVMSRPGFDLRQASPEFSRLAKVMNVPQVGISGTDIRRRVKLGRSIRYLVPKSVEDFIRHANLYR
jgi:nicotinate-nucleotide adenylyltransferase